MGDAPTQSWWKFTFLRKKMSSPKVLYELPVDQGNTESKECGERETQSRADSELEAKLEKIVDKTTKGRHVRVSNSGRFKEKKKVRVSLAENPDLYNDSENGGRPEP